MSFYNVIVNKFVGFIRCRKTSVINETEISVNGNENRNKKIAKLIWKKTVKIETETEKYFAI